jgi:outer membrane receptor for ferrienterochelin and colicins
VTERDFSTVGTNVWVYPTEQTRISANYGFTAEERRGGDSLDRLPHETQITEALEHRWHRGGLFLEQDFGPDRYLRVGGSVSHLERDSYYGGVGDVALPGQPGHDPVAFAAAVDDARLLYGYTESTRYFLDALSVWNLGNHVLSFGAQYKHDTVFDEKRDDRNRPLRTDGTRAAVSGEDPIADGSFNNLGFFIQDEWDPTRDLCLITGLRMDRHSALDTWVLSPRAAVRYNAGTDWVLRASVSTGFRAPEIFNEDFHIEILDDPTRTRNAPGLKEESSVSLAAGFVYTPAAAGGRLQADVEFYRTVIDDTFNVPDIVFTDPAGNAFKQRVNAGGSVVQGVEANLLYRFTDRLSVETGVTFNDAAFDQAQEVVSGAFEDRYLESPRWSGVTRFTYTNEDLIDLFLGVVWTGPMIAVNEEDGFLNRDTPHFFVVDLSATRHFNFGSGDDGAHLDLTVGVRNLFDERQDDLTSGPGRDAGYFYGSRFPRSVFASATYRF